MHISLYFGVKHFSDLYVTCGHVGDIGGARCLSGESKKIVKMENGTISQFPLPFYFLSFLAGEY